MEFIAHIPSVLRNHAEGAAFLWAQRANYMDDPSIGEEELGRLDRRLTAHLAGLLASGATSLVELQARFDDFPQSGEAFAFLTTAILASETDAVNKFLDVADELPECWPGLSGAVAWSKMNALGPFVRDWAGASLSIKRYLAVAAHSHLRADPGYKLDDFLADADARVRTRALRLLGELGKQGRAKDLLARMTESEGKEQFAAARSALFLGQKGIALEIMRRWALEPGDDGDIALELAVLADHGEEGRAWLGEVMRDEGRRVAAVEISGVVDTEEVREWLFDCASDPNLSAAAGRAIRGIYEIDFDDTNAFEIEGAVLGPDFAHRTDGPWPVASRIKEALKNSPKGAAFQSLPRQRRQHYLEAMANPGSTLGDWRGRRLYPAWS